MYNEEEKEEYEKAFFIEKKKEMNSMRGKLKENLHVRPTQTRNVAIS